MDFKSVARKQTTASPVMEGRDKVSMEELIKRGGIVTVNEFDFMQETDRRTGEVKVYPVFSTVEYPNEFCFGGIVLKNICDAWMDSFGSNNTDEVSKALKESGGVRMKFTPGKTKDGRQCTNIDILD